MQAFDTLGYTKRLVAKGYERDKAEALAEAQQEFFAKDVATEDFVRAEIQQAVARLESRIELENALLENRLAKKAFGKTVMACTGILLVGIPLIQAIIQKLG